MDDRRVYGTRCTLRNVGGDPQRDRRPGVEEFGGSITSFGWRADDGSCARFGPRHHFYSIVAIHPSFAPCTRAPQTPQNTSVYCQTRVYDH